MEERNKRLRKQRNSDYWDTPMTPEESKAYSRKMWLSSAISTVVAGVAAVLFYSPVIIAIGILMIIGTSIYQKLNNETISVRMWVQIMIPNFIIFGIASWFLIKPVFKTFLPFLEM